MVVLDLNGKRRSSPPGQAAFCSSEASSGSDGSLSANTSDHYGIELTGSVLSAVQRHVLAGDSFNDLADRVDEIKARLKGMPERAVLLQSANEVGSILSAFQDRLRDSNRETAIDFQKVLSLLNENFSFIQAGDEKSEERLRYFERGLSLATRMDSLVSLRKHLSGMLEYVRKEGKLDGLEKETKLRSITEQMRQAQAAGSHLRVNMPGRPEALEYIKALGAAANGKPEGSAGLFLVDSLKALRARHGEEIAANILVELGRKQIPKDNIASAGLLHAVPSTFEHRAFTGNRMATFKVNIRSISTSLSRGPDEVAAALDRFCKENAA